MNVIEAAQVIRDTVTMDQILGMFGYQAKHGFLPCPFHGDSNASLKVYKGAKGWHCFGCGRGGSAIDFVMEHEHIPFRGAVIQIDRELGLGLVSMDNMFQQDRNRKDQKRLDAIREELDGYIEMIEEAADRQLRFYVKWVQEIEKLPVPERTPDEWDTLMWLSEEMQYIDYIMEKCHEFRKEVIEWRNQRRRGP